MIMQAIAERNPSRYKRHRILSRTEASLTRITGPLARTHTDISGSRVSTLAQLTPERLSQAWPTRTTSRTVTSRSVGEVIDFIASRLSVKGPPTRSLQEFPGPGLIRRKTQPTP